MTNSVNVGSVNPSHHRGIAYLIHFSINPDINLSNGSRNITKDFQDASCNNLSATTVLFGLYRSLASYDLANYVTNDTRQPGLAPDRLANPDLTWETTTQLDIGLELGLFKDRIFLNLDYYNKVRPIIQWL